MFNNYLYVVDDENKEEFKDMANLKLSTVKKVSKQLDETQVHIIEEGNYIGEQITFQPIFDDVKIEEALTELTLLLNEAIENGIEISQTMQVYLLHMYAIKYFTHFKNALPSTLLGENKKAGMLDTLDHFRKTGLLSECVNNMFLPAEINKYINKATEMAAVGLLSQDLDEKMKEKFESLQLKNKSVFEQLGKIDTGNKVVQ